MPVLVSAASVALPSSSSDLFSAVLFICVEMSGGLGAGSIVHPGGSGEVIGGLATHGMESSSHCTTHQNPSKLVKGIPHPWEYHYLADLKPSVHVILPPIEFLS